MDQHLGRFKAELPAPNLSCDVRMPGIFEGIQTPGTTWCPAVQHAGVEDPPATTSCIWASSCYCCCCRLRRALSS